MARPARALVIGGGEGATIREILRYPSITRAVMVDIDDEVVEICKRHLPEMHQGAFEDPRTEVRHEDARGYLERSGGALRPHHQLDLVEPLEEGPACLLYSKEFYSDRARPADPGRYLHHAGRHDQGRRAVVLHRHPPDAARGVPRGRRLPVVRSPASAPPGASSSPRRRSTRAGRTSPPSIGSSRTGSKARSSYWDGQTHQHAFALPKHIRKAVEPRPVSPTDKHPLIVA